MLNQLIFGEQQAIWIRSLPLAPSIHQKGILYVLAVYLMDIPCSIGPAQGDRTNSITQTGRKSTGNGASFIHGFHVYVDTCEPPAISKLFQLKLAGALAIHPAC